MARGGPYFRTSKEKNRESKLFLGPESRVCVGEWLVRVDGVDLAVGQWSEEGIAEGGVLELVLDIREVEAY